MDGQATKARCNYTEPLLFYCSLPGRIFPPGFTAGIQDRKIGLLDAWACAACPVPQKRGQDHNIVIFHIAYNPARNGAC